MEPHWLMVVSWIALALGFGSALVILADELLLGHRQQMAIMNVVHPVTALYWGPVWLWAYFRNGRKSSRKALREEARRFDGDVEELARQGASTDGQDVRPWNVGNAVSHCGAGCTLGDIGGEWLLFAIGAPALGVLGTYGWEIVADFALAWTLGIVFQYLTIVPMRSDVGRVEGVRQAVKVDTLSILAFQVGLFGWMAVSHFVLFRPPLPVDTSGHWFMMQVGMIVGYFTAWPVNRLLVVHGVKEKMDHRTHLAMLVEEMRDEEDAPPAADEAIARDRDSATGRSRERVPGRSR